MKIIITTAEEYGMPAQATVTVDSKLIYVGALSEEARSLIQKIMDADLNEKRRKANEQR